MTQGRDEYTEKFKPDQSKINKENRFIYSKAVCFLGVIILLDIAVIGFLAYKSLEVPDALIAIGSVAVGALSNLFKAD